MAFYVLYVVLGAIILGRILRTGFHWESISGIVLGLALMALGIYRLRLVLSMRISRP